MDTDGCLWYILIFIGINLVLFSFLPIINADLWLLLSLGGICCCVLGAHLSLNMTKRQGKMKLYKRHLLYTSITGIISAIFWAFIKIYFF